MGNTTSGKTVGIPYPQQELHDRLPDDATFHHEDALDDNFDRQVTEGRQRLARPRPQQFVTGFLGGVEIGLGVLIGMSVTHATGSMLLGGLAFSLGFVTLLLAHSELFTEGFLVPTFAVIARRAKLVQLLRFWFYTFLGNLAGGLIVMWVMVTAFPAIHSTLDDFGEHFAGLQPRLDTALLAIMAGVSITLMTRMQMGTDQVIGKIVAAVFGGVLLFGVGMLHSVLDTLLMLGAWFAGAPEVSLLNIVNFLWWVIPLNMFGGIVGVALPRAIQARDRVRIERLRVVRELLMGVELANDARGALKTGREVRAELEQELCVMQEDEPEPEPTSWEGLGDRIVDTFGRLGQLRPLQKWVASGSPAGNTAVDGAGVDGAASTGSSTTAATIDATTAKSNATMTAPPEAADATPAAGVASAAGVAPADATSTTPAAAPSPAPTSLAATEEDDKKCLCCKRKRAERAARDAERAARDAHKDAQKAAAKAAERAEKAAKDARKEERKAARRAAKRADRSAEESIKQAKRTQKEAVKRAERAKKEALKRAERAAKHAAKEAERAARRAAHGGK